MFIPPESRLNSGQQGAGPQIPLKETSPKDIPTDSYRAPQPQALQRSSTSSPFSNHSNSNFNNSSLNTSQNTGEFVNIRSANLNSVGSEHWSRESRHPAPRPRAFSSNSSSSTSSFRGKSNYITRGYSSSYSQRSRGRGGFSRSHSNEYRPPNSIYSRFNQQNPSQRKFTPITSLDIESTHQNINSFPNNPSEDLNSFSSSISSNNTSSALPKMTSLSDIGNISKVSNNSASNTGQQIVAPLGIGSKGVTFNQLYQSATLNRSKQDIANKSDNNTEKPVYNELLRPTHALRNTSFSNSLSLDLSNEGANLTQAQWEIPSDISITDFLDKASSFLIAVEKEYDVRTWRDSSVDKPYDIHILGTVDNVKQAKISFENRARSFYNEIEDEPRKSYSTGSKIPRSPPKSENRARKEERKILRAETIKDYKCVPLTPHMYNSFFIFLDDKTPTAVFGENLNSLDGAIFSLRVNIWLDKEVNQVRISSESKEGHDLAYDIVSKIYENHFYKPLDPFPSYLLYLLPGLDIKIESPPETWMVNTFKDNGTIATTYTPMSPASPDLYDYNEFNHKFTAKQITNALHNLKGIHGRVELKLYLGKVVYNRNQPLELRPREARERLESPHSRPGFAHFHHNISPIANSIENLLEKCDKIFKKQLSPQKIEYSFKVYDVDQSTHKFICEFDNKGKPIIENYYYDDDYPAVIYHSTPNNPLDYSSQVRVNRVMSQPSKYLTNFADSIYMNTTNDIIYFTNNIAISMKQVVKSKKYRYSMNNYTIIVTDYEVFDFEKQQLKYEAQYIPQQKSVPIIASESGQSIAISRSNWNDLNHNICLKPGGSATWNKDELFNERLSEENYSLIHNYTKQLFSQTLF